MKHLLLYICDDYLDFLASKLYMVDIPPVDLQSQIYLLWEHYDKTTDFTTFVFENLNLFFDIFCFIQHFYYRSEFIVKICRYI